MIATELEEKIFSALERIYTARRSALQKTVHDYGISALQAEIMGFIARRGTAGVSQLAEQMKLSKPTISDAVASLLEKKLLKKTRRREDARGHHLSLTAKGTDISAKIAHFADPLLGTLSGLKIDRKHALWEALLHLLKTMQIHDLIPPQRMCFTCRHFESSKKGNHYYCRLMESPLPVTSVRIDCNEHQELNG